MYPKDRGSRNCTPGTKIWGGRKFSQTETICRLSDRGTIALGVALALNMGLQYLKLNNNHISDAAGKAFAELIEKNYKLLSVDFRGNQVCLDCEWMV